MADEELRDALITIRRFLDGTDEVWDWDDFLSVPAQTTKVAQLQGFCRQLPTAYPPEQKTDYCNALGLQKLREVVIETENTWINEPPDSK